jgi:hypothetical protein
VTEVTAVLWRVAWRAEARRQWRGMGLLGLPIECQVVAVVAVVAVFLVTNIEHGSRLMSSFSIQVKEHQRCEVYYSFTLATATVSATSRLYIYKV